MSETNALRFDEDHRRKDNLGCKAKLAKAGRELPKMTERILKSSFEEFQEKGFLDGLLRLITESKTDIAAAEAICNAIGEEIKSFAVAVGNSRDAFRGKREELLKQIKEKEKKREEDANRKDSTAKAGKGKGIGLEDLYLQLNKVQQALEGVGDRDSEEHTMATRVLEGAKEAEKDKKKKQAEKKVKSQTKAIEKTVSNLERDCKRAEEAAEECRRLCEQIKPDTDENQRMVEELNGKIKATEEIKARVAEVTSALREIDEEMKASVAGGDAASSGEEIEGTLERLEERKQEAEVVGDRLKTLAETNEDMVAMAKEYIENASQIEDVNLILKEAADLVEDSDSAFAQTSDDIARFQEDFKQTIKGNLAELRAGNSLKGQTPEEYASKVCSQIDAEKEKCRGHVEKVKELSRKVQESSSQLKSASDAPNAKKVPKIANKVKRQSKEMKKTKEALDKTVEEINNFIRDSTCSLQRKCMTGKGLLSIDKLKKDVGNLEAGTDQLKQIAGRMDAFYEDIKQEDQNTGDLGDEYQVGAKEVQAAIEGGLDKISQSESLIRNFKTFLQNDEFTDEEFAEQFEAVQVDSREVASAAKLIETERIQRKRWVNEAETRIKGQRRNKVNEHVTEFLQGVETIMGHYSQVEADAAKATDDAETSAKHCCRDTNEARKAIQLVIENAELVKKSLQAGKACFVKNQANIGKLQALAKKDEPSAEEIDEAKETIEKNVESLNKTSDAVKSCVEKLNRSVEEMEVKNPTNWKTFKFYHGEEENDDELMCVIRAPPGILDDVPIHCNTAEDLLHSAMGPHDRVFSPVVKIDPQDKLFAKFVLVAIPYSKYDPQRKRDRSIMVKNTVDGKKWHVSHTNSTDRTISQFKGLVFAEIATKQLSTYIVISRVVEDRATIDKKGEVMTSSVEQRVCVEYPIGTIKAITEVALKVQLVEQASVNQLKERHKAQVADLETSSPIINITYSPIPTFDHPVTLTVPLPNATKAAPSTPNPQPVPQHHGAPRRTSEQSEDGSIHVMVKNIGEKWQELSLQKSGLKTCKNDVVMFDVTEPFPKLLVLKSSGSERSSKPEMAREVEEWTEIVSVVRFVFHQHDDDRTNAIAQIVPQNGCQQLLDDLSEQGYSGPPDPSNEFELREEQEVSIRFKGTGNIDFSDGGGGGGERRMKFYRGRSNRAQFWVKERDPYRNQGDFNKGVVEIYAKAVQQSTARGDAQGGEDKFTFVESLPVAIPKREMQTITRERTFCESDYKGTLSDEGLRDLAKEVGIEFRRLASYLGTTNARMQRIIKDNPNSTEDQIFEMLVTWRQGQPRSANKLKLLKRALVKAERRDLAEKIQ